MDEKVELVARAIDPRPFARRAAVPTIDHSNAFMVRRFMSDSARIAAARSAAKRVIEALSALSQPGVK